MIFNSKHVSSGFTLIEMMVVIAIVAILSAAVIFSYQGFSNKLAVSAASQDIATAIRQAQVYGVSVKESSQGTGDFSAGYGIYISMNTPGQYTIFTDEDGNGVYDGGAHCGSGGDCSVEQDTLRNSAFVTSLCDAGSCAPDGATAVSIVFVRPNPNAIIRFSSPSGTFLDQSAKIVISSSGAVQSSVTVQSTGQISTQ